MLCCTVHLHQCLRVELVVHRHGGETTVYKEYAPLEKAFADKQIHPADLKDAVTAAINKVSGITLLLRLRVS